MVKHPRTLREAILHFSRPENCHEYMVSLRWPDGKVTCPHCGSKDVDYLPNAKVFKCFAKPAHAKAKFSLKVGTIFEESPIGLDKWLPVMWMVVNCKNGVSSWEIHRAMGVTQKSAWFMLQRCRLAMQDDLTGGMLSGEVEIDESWIGGKARNMHKEKKAKMQKLTRKGSNKTIVLGILEREGKVRTAVIPDRTKQVMQEHVRANVEQGSQLYSDEAAYHWRMDDEYVHGVVNHLEAYVNGNVHTNGLENFWSLLKRGLGGTYVSVEPFHLFRYVDEQAYRYNNRKATDGERFHLAMKQAVGRRLTYAELTGKPEGETPAPQAMA